jgi:hypothetical protein
MPDKTSGAARSAEAIDKDFADLMASEMPGAVARDKFESLWDEINAIAAQTIDTAAGQQYLSLLKRMHQTFESRYPAKGAMNGYGKRRP